MSEVKDTEKKEGSDKPKVLVLGGCGFIGRNFIKYLVDNKFCSKIRVADKARPETSYMSDAHKASFDNKDVIEFTQADLSKDATVEKLFSKDKFDYVFNCCGETRFGLSQDDYKVKSFDTAVKTGTAASKNGVKKFVEISTAQVYEPTPKPSKEDDKLAPWTIQATYRLKAEEELKKLKDLNLVILRPAIVYGPGDLVGLTPRIVCAAVYGKTKKTMKFLWGEELRLDVVHVDDLVRAMWIAANEAKPGSVYNVADAVDLTQGKLNGWLGSIFSIKTDFFGSITSNLAKMNLAGVAEEANNDHVPSWSTLCQEHKIANTPLSPYIDKELLSNNSLCVDGSKICKETSFKQYDKPVTDKLIKEQVQSFIDQKLFPAVL